MTRTLELVKMQGAGNDFLVLDGEAQELPRPDRLARRLCDRRLGVGADQLLVLRRAGPGADFRMEVYNADGSASEMSGNGARVFYRYLRAHGHTRAESIAIETLAGVVRARGAGPDRVEVEMGRPVLVPAKIPTRLGSGAGPVLDQPLDLGGETVRLTCVSMGNPHAVLFVDDVERAPLAELGPRIERHPSFPARVNVELVEVVSRERVRQRTWERGAGETLACGSGACAAVVAGVLRGATGRRVRVSLRGGDLDVAWAADDGPVLLSGPAAEVFRGRIELRGD